MVLDCVKLTTDTNSHRDKDENDVRSVKQGGTPDPKALASSQQPCGRASWRQVLQPHSSFHDAELLNVLTGIS